MSIFEFSHFLPFCIRSDLTSVFQESRNLETNDLLFFIVSLKVFQSSWEINLTSSFRLYPRIDDFCVIRQNVWEYFFTHPLYDTYLSGVILWCQTEIEVETRKHKTSIRALLDEIALFEYRYAISCIVDCCVHTRIMIHKKSFPASIMKTLSNQFFKMCIL